MLTRNSLENMNQINQSNLLNVLCILVPTALRSIYVIHKSNVQTWSQIITSHALSESAVIHTKIILQDVLT
jgi:hypothetical protein